MGILIEAFLPVDENSEMGWLKSHPTCMNPNDPMMKKQMDIEYRATCLAMDIGLLDIMFVGNLALLENLKFTVYYEGKIAKRPDKSPVNSNR